MNPYKKFVADYAQLVSQGRSLPLGGFKAIERPDPGYDAPKALFFSPHPDDECISGAVALRLMREARMNVVNVAVTQGSKKERQAERYIELENACHYIGFGLVATAANGLEKINPKTRNAEPAYWHECVKVIAAILETNQPKVVMFPHEHDWNGTHIGTHFLVMDALKQMPIGFECYIVETEFWGQMSDPNLMMEVSVDDLADTVAATTFHAGEVKRNPFHLLLPAWMLDNVRRGSELVGGQGGAAPDFGFAALYRVRKWGQGRVSKLFDGGKQFSRSRNIGELFP
jgi:LmbE family N-acetylglucosaminyl deacetylase